VSVVDIASGRISDEIPTGVEPEGMVVSPDGKTIVNTSETTSMAHFIDAASHKMIASVLVGSRPRFAAFTKDGSKVWVSSEVGGNVSIIDVATHKVIHTITFAIPGVPAETIQAVGINLSPDGKWGFVALGPANRVAVVDAASFAVKKYLLVGQRVWHMDFSFDGKTLYTANGVSNDMSVIDVEDLKVTKSVPVGHLPWGVVYGP
jgi:PQQ-dependent catabolism-associated beta-propeller protein